MTVRKNSFEMSVHAHERANQRGMLHPHDIGLRVANRKTKKKIVESCSKEGYKKDCIYWTQIIDNERLVYVTVQKDVGKYLVLTCFKYKI